MVELTDQEKRVFWGQPALLVNRALISRAGSVVRIVFSEGDGDSYSYRVSVAMSIEDANNILKALANSVEEPKNDG
jgi:hypothetical protein